MRDEQGAEVQRLDIATSQEPLVWAGVGVNGDPFPSGTYSFETVSYALGQQISQTPSESYRRVTEVQALDGQTVLILEGGVQVNATDVTALRDPNLS